MIYSKFDFLKDMPDYAIKCGFALKICKHLSREANKWETTVCLKSVLKLNHLNHLLYAE